MIKLKPLLTETYNKIDNLFNTLRFTSTYLPISIPIIKKMVGNVRTTKAAHVTTIDKFKTLQQLEGKKKGISSFNALKSDSRILKGHGVATKGGVIVILEGDLLLNSKWDQYTRIDPHGRNWTSVPELFSGKDHFLMDDVLPPEALEMRKIPYRIKPTPEQKQWYIKTYIDVATREMLKRKDAFQKMYFSKPDVQSDDDDLTWNEIILTRIKIKEVAFIEDEYRPFTDDEEKIIKNTKNSVVIKIKDIPKFLKKHNVVIK